ncbi:uncharacterized protein BP5553_05515 [Venustampulla echinocandica]|uniref:Uncharacterized protein n=1 Tax=Venustampulla echinocandica TaxID=2656787 RepID=A0A370TRC8_9HELO|nr:uncharacterized protein BP5553_05515 [Venustampulla echinocandica]RDL38082.1 hypothetical protein BP5553_05515 [Venustampulla echinocandica]
MGNTTYIDPESSSNSDELSPFRVISSSIPKIPNGPADLADLISSAKYHASLGGRSIVQVNGKSAFIIWLGIVTERSAWIFEDALGHATNFFDRGNESSTSFLFTDTGEKEDGEESVATSYLVSILKVSGKASESVLLSYEDRLALQESTESPPSWKKSLAEFRGRNRFLGLTAAAVLILVLTLTVFWAWSRQQPLAWIHWDTTGSEGPRYQLQFTHHNVSDWDAALPHGNDDWFVRLDDQSMIPPHLVDETELRYQKWYRNRYPEVDAVRLNESYSKESFLSDPFAIQIPIDDLFHPAHCVLALRRYWQAKETGKHVCPRDLDRRHMKHCLDSLDEYLFFEGERGSIREIPKIQQDTLVWRTKVCF